MAKIEKLFQILQQQGGSDLHMSPGNPPLIRVSGQLRPAINQVLNGDQNRALVYEIMSEMDQALQKLVNDKRVSVDEAARFAANKAQFTAQNAAAGGQ